MCVSVRVCVHSMAMPSQNQLTVSLALEAFVRVHPTVDLFPILRCWCSPPEGVGCVCVCVCVATKHLAVSGWGGAEQE